MLSASRSEVIGDVPGLQSVATAIGTPMLAQEGDRRRLRLAQHIKGAGQQRRDDARVRHRRDALLVGIFEMIGRQRAEVGGKRRAAAVRQLIGMQLDRKPSAPRRGEHARDLVAREGDRLAKAVDGVDQRLRPRAPGASSSTTSST